MSHATPVEQRKARRDYRCHWCGGPIPKGTSHAAWTWFDEGRAETVRTHPECAEAWHALSVWDREEVHFADYSRGCTCENGRCECAAVAAREDTT